MYLIITLVSVAVALTCLCEAVHQFTQRRIAESECSKLLDKNCWMAAELQGYRKGQDLRDRFDADIPAGQRKGGVNAVS